MSMITLGELAEIVLHAPVVDQGRLERLALILGGEDWDGMDWTALEREMRAVKPLLEARLAAARAAGQAVLALRPRPSAETPEGF